MSFISAVKSTLDYQLGRFAQSAGKPYFDIDQAEWTTQALEDINEGLLFSLASMQEDPRDPLWSVLFSVGVRLRGDLAQYETLRLSAIQTFPMHQTIPVYDYGVATAPDPAIDAPLGFLLPVESRLEPISFDRVSGVRPVQFHAKAWRVVA